MTLGDTDAATADDDDGGLDECDFHDNENDNDHDKKTANSDVYPMSSLATATNYEHAADHLVYNRSTVARSQISGHAKPWIRQNKLKRAVKARMLHLSQYIGH